MWTLWLGLLYVALQLFLVFTDILCVIEIHGIVNEVLTLDFGVMLILIDGHLGHKHVRRRFFLLITYFWLLRHVY